MVLAVAKLKQFLHKPCQRLLFHKKGDDFHVPAVILSAFSRNPKFADCVDTPQMPLKGASHP
jgi:hypothetical protein